MRKHRVLIVDDSASMRHLIASVLLDTPDIEVVGQAADALEAREAIKKLNPDVVTLDVEMPKMNGIEFLEKLMRLRPTPVIMVSNFTSSGGDLTVKALAMGAVDCIGKPQPGDKTLFAGLTDKIRIAADVRFRPPAAHDKVDHGRETDPHANYRPDGRIVAMGSSAGGVEALSAVLEGFPANCPPMLITQHMPEMFTKSLAARLDRLCNAHVSEAVDGAPLDVGHIYVAPGGAQHLTVSGVGPYRCRLVPSGLVSGHRPSVDVLFQSVAKVVGKGAVGVILSGMGRDGADGLLAMRKAGAKTIGQDAASSFIYGMPRTAHEAGGVERQLPLKKIGAEILSMTNQKPG
ncbi:chemotaxis response regulator protein-glutamate methylesterase [Beijerinckia sp. L45]|uniref:protein-glutamate methylesterase/protein-glutamine glutaminase n=1 Tax=Beijerinckia sp. L45 TaxID=1641855 RepID=UPI00131E5C82|nr:chemotaxis response regulator protein-glutamate methylesterase [Beijerinckia sp. L45]